MTRRGQHLDDEQLFTGYIAVCEGDSLDRPSAAHLAVCQACSVRYDEIVRLMAALREEAISQADAVFTPERLHAQARGVARRVGRVGQVARVINFPRRFVARSIKVRPSHSVSRWVAAAAAAGLFIGAALGASYQAPWWSRPARETGGFFQPPPPSGRSMLTHVTAARSVSQADLAADDAFLVELELVADRPHPRELVPFDALTPHVREIVDIR